jgi:hypothetical protein
LITVVASHSSYIQDWGYIIPRTSMAPWVGNLISSFQTKISPTLIKIDRTTNLLLA